MPSEWDQYLSSPRWAEPESEFDKYLTGGVATDEEESEFDQYVSRETLPQLLPAHGPTPPVPSRSTIPISAGPFSAPFEIGQAMGSGREFDDRTETTPELLGRVGRTMSAVPPSAVPGVAQVGKAIEFLMSPPEEEEGVRPPYQSELDFFKDNPDVSGMASEDGFVVLNPFARLTPEGRAKTIRNEKARLYIDEKKITPTFNLTERQKAFFANYSKDERDIKNTIVARIIAGDESAQDATPEQREFATKVRSDMEGELSDSRFFDVPNSFWRNAARAVGQLIPGVVEVPRKLLSPSKQDKIDAIHEIEAMLPNVRGDLRESLGTLVGSMTDAATVMFGDEDARKRLALSGGLEPAISAAILTSPFGAKPKAEMAKARSLTEQGRLAESTTIPEMRRSEGMENLRRTEAEIKRESEFDQYVMERDELGQRIAGERAQTEAARLAEIDRETRGAEARQRQGMANLAETEAGIKADVAEVGRASAWDQYIRDRENLEPLVAYERYVDRLSKRPALEGPVEGEGFLMRDRPVRQPGEEAPTALEALFKPAEKAPTRREFRPEGVAETPKAKAFEDPRDVLENPASYPKRVVEDAIIAGEEMFKSGRDRKRVSLGPRGLDELRDMLTQAREAILEKKPAPPPAPEVSQIRTTNQKVRWNIAPKSVAWEVLKRIEDATHAEGPGMIFEGKNVTRYGTSRPKWIQDSGLSYQQIRGLIEKVRKGEEITESQYGKLKRIYDDAKHFDLMEGQRLSLSEQRAARQRAQEGLPQGFGKQNKYFTEGDLDAAFDPNTFTSGFDPAAAIKRFAKGEEGGFDPAVLVNAAGYYIEGGIREYPRIAERLRERFPGITSAEIARAFRDAGGVLAKRGIEPVVVPKREESSQVRPETGQVRPLETAPITPRVNETKTHGWTGEVYRGTGRDQPNDFGVAGKGQYFTPDERAAKWYGPNVEKRRVSLESPLVATYDELNALQERVVGGVVTGFDKAKAEAFDAYMREQGYDGAVLYEGSVSTKTPSEVVVLAKKDPTTIPVKEAKFAQEGIRPATPREVQDKIGAEVQKVLEDAGMPPDVSSTIGMNKVEQDRIRRILNLPDLKPADIEGFRRALTDAKTSNADHTAMDVAREIKYNRRPITPREHAGIVLKGAQLMDAYEKSIALQAKYVDEGRPSFARAERKRSDLIIEDYDLLTEATRMGRRETARSLGLGRMFINRQDYSLAAVTQRVKAAKGKPLTEADHVQIKKLVDEQFNLQMQLVEMDKKYADLVAQNKRLQAEKITVTEQKRAKIERRTTELKDELAKEQKDIEKQLVGLGFRVNDITGLGPETAYLIGRYAINVMRQGETSLEGVVRKVRDKLPELTELDVYEAINTRDPKVQAKAKAEHVDHVSSMRRQAALLTDLAKMGEIRTPEAVEVLKKRLHELRKESYRAILDEEKLSRALQKINELQDQLSNKYRPIKDKSGKIVEGPELQAARGEIRKLVREMNVDDALAKAEEQLRTGQVPIRTPKQQTPLPEPYQRKQIELKRARRKIQELVHAQEPLKPYSETLNTLRTLKATADFSATLRQGLILTDRLLVTRPLKLPPIVAQTLKATFHEYTAQKIDHWIRNQENYPLMERAKLELTELEGFGTLREEHFNSRLIDRIPVLREITQGSSRHMTTYLNLLRQEAFNDFVRKVPNATDAELAVWANWINVTTGRGKITPGAAKGLASVFFAPRFAASRFQTPYYAIKGMRESPRVRAEIIKDIVSTTTLALSAMALAKLAGLEVGTEVRSPDFGKIRVGDTRFDIFAGFQQPARLVLKLGLMGTDRAGWTGKDLMASDRDPADGIQTVARFLSFKLSPPITLANEILTGKTVVGEEVTGWETLENALLPLVYNDIRDAWKSGGIERASVVSPLVLLGIGASTYEDSEAETRRKIRRLKREGKTAEWEKIQIEWNDKNPENRIVNVEVEE